MNYIFAGRQKRGRPKKGDACVSFDLQEWLSDARPDKYEWLGGARSKMRCLVCNPPSIFTIFRPNSSHDVLLHERHSQRHAQSLLQLQRPEASRSPQTRCSGWHPEVTSVLPPGQLSLSQAAWVQRSHPNASHRIYLSSRSIFSIVQVCFTCFLNHVLIQSPSSSHFLREHSHCVCNISRSQGKDAIAAYAEEGCPDQAGNAKFCGFDKWGLFVRSPECIHNGELTFDAAKSQCCDLCITFASAKKTRCQVLVWATRLHTLAYAEYRVQGEGAAEFLAKWKAMDYVSCGAPEIAAEVASAERSSTLVLVNQVASAFVCVCVQGG